MKIGKLDGGRLVQVVRIADRVAFSSQRGWVFIVLDFERPVRKQRFYKWVPASTRFEWIRDFDFTEES